MLPTSLKRNDSIMQSAGLEDESSLAIEKSLGLEDDSISIGIIKQETAEDSEELELLPDLDSKVELPPEADKMLPESPCSPETLEPANPFDAGFSPEDINRNESIKLWLQRISKMQTKIQKKIVADGEEAKQQTRSAPSRVVKYQDLPYMGEMTLDNSKPRRGRKPKKADICHLIYKNYGTIFPGTPNAKSLIDRGEAATRKHEADAGKSDVQNKIISSLLEKRLTQESKVKVKEIQNEPLNLCIRDLDHLKIQKETTQVKSEPQSDNDDVEFVSESPSSSEPKIPNVEAVQNKDVGNCVYWPNTGFFIHPIALQQQLLNYQKMTNNNTFMNPLHPEVIEELPELRKLIPKQKKTVTEENICGESEPKTKRNATGNEKTPAKRKRSAIFIPPIPTENPNNPATEVSICKFKFTGGAKPSLQEKKMLSVDSGGNFRYYSGTGDKSMRGYEFFPRETLQQQINTAQCSSTGAFLQASGEKIYPTSPADVASKANEFMLTPSIQTPIPPVTDLTPVASRAKKRKSRKSLQREKLEQTFKEKGFLIQTQQLESAEGATYCKFRQLRKFTRYLFRSWKDYLPGNVQDNPEAIEDFENLPGFSGASAAAAFEQDASSSST